MRHKALLLSLALAVTIALGAGSTLALFRAAALNPDNVFVAGTVAIEFDRDLGDPIPGPMFYTTLEEGRSEDGQPPKAENITGPWAPGDTHIRIGDMRNSGNLDIYVEGVSVSLQEPAALSQPHIGYELLVTITTPDPHAPGGMRTLIDAAPMHQFIDNMVPFSQRLLLMVNSGNQDLWFHVHLPLWLGDPTPDDPDGTAYMGQRLKVQFNLHATQAAHNP